jgi:hypothetical protein
MDSLVSEVSLIPRNLFPTVISFVMLRQLFRKRWHSLEKSAVAEQQSILIDSLILDNTHALFTYLPKSKLFIPGSDRL